MEEDRYRPHPAYSCVGKEVANGMRYQHPPHPQQSYSYDAPVNRPYFPTQKRENMFSSISSGLISPVISPKNARASSIS